MKKIGFFKWQISANAEIVFGIAMVLAGMLFMYFFVAAMVRL